MVTKNYKLKIMQKILLVEDDPFLIDIYKKKLTKAGFSLEVAEDGEKALEAAKAQKPDLILLDIVLPKASGWEVLKKMRKQAGLEKVKIIILSNLGQKEEVEKGLKLGAVRYLIKAQHTPSEVVDAVKSILK